MKFIEVKSNGKEFNINPSQIVYFQISDIYVNIQLSDGTFLKTKTLYSDFNEQLI